jgi:O-antigen/teichoic acid export membrane protein
MNSSLPKTEAAGDAGLAQRRQTLGTLAVQGFRVAGLFGLNVLLARVLGKEGFGRWGFAMSVVTILLFFACLGMDGVLLRFVSAYRSQADPAALGGVVRFGLGAVMLTGVTLGALGCGVVYVLGDRIDPALQWTLYASLGLLLPLQALAEVLRPAVQSLGQATRSQIPRFILRPVALAAIAAAGTLLGWSWSAGTIIVIDAAVMLAGAGLLAWWLFRMIGREISQAPARYAMQQWLAAGLMLMATAAFSTLNAQTDLLMVGSLLGIAAVGPYKAAVQTSLLVLLGNLAGNAAAAGAISAGHATGDREAMFRAVDRAALVAGGFALLSGAALLLTGRWVLGIFGEGFVVAWPAMLILIVSGVLNALAGPSCLVLTMTGRQKHAAGAIAASVLVNVALNLLLIPRLGLVGAAVGSLAGALLAQAYMVFRVWRDTGMCPTTLHALRRWRGRRDHNS